MILETLTALFWPEQKCEWSKKQTAATIGLLKELAKNLKVDANPGRNQRICRELREQISFGDYFPDCIFKDWLEYYFHKHHNRIPPLKMVEEAIQLFKE